MPLQMVIIRVASKCLAEARNYKNGISQLKSKAYQLKNSVRARNGIQLSSRAPAWHMCGANFKCQHHRKKQQQNLSDLKSRVKNANTGLRNIDTGYNIS